MIKNMPTNVRAAASSPYSPDATVTVMLTEINSLKAYVIGKVNTPGMYDITLETNVMQILAQAGKHAVFAYEDNF